MRRPRCSVCYRPVGAGTHLCPPSRVGSDDGRATRRAEHQAQRSRSTVNRRRNPLSRDEYLAEHRKPAEHKRALANARQRAYKARQRAKQRAAA